LSDGSVLELRHDAHGDVVLSALPSVLHVGYRGAGGSLETGAVKKLLQELRVVPRLRGRVPLIRDGAELVAVADLWVAPRHKATARPQRPAIEGAALLRGRFYWSAVPD
jgi:tRNA(Ile)-lysidine synthetase-like protein